MPVYKKVSCPVCDCPEKINIGPVNGGNTPVRIPDDSKIVICKKCRLIYVTPMPYWSGEDFGRLYNETYFSIDKSKEQWMNIRQNENPPMRFEFIKPYIKSEAKKMLEIGAGEFAFMCRFLRDKGWDITAQEPSVFFQDKLRAIENLKTETCGITELTGEGSYSFIYADSVLEHIPDPVPHYRKLASLLAPGGILYTVSPNEYSMLNFLLNIKAKLKGDTPHYISPYKPPYHLIGFTKKSLKILAAKSGLELVHYKKWHDYMAAYTLNGGLNPLIKFPAALLFALSQKLGMGTNGEALFRKPCFQ
jgi:SAM-dependent methyltransferase